MVAVKAQDDFIFRPWISRCGTCQSAMDQAWFFDVVQVGDGGSSAWTAKTSFRLEVVSAILPLKGWLNSSPDMMYQARRRKGGPEVCICWCDGSSPKAQDRALTGGRVVGFMVLFMNRWIKPGTSASSRWVGGGSSAWTARVSR